MVVTGILGVGVDPIHTLSRTKELGGFSAPVKRHNLREELKLVSEGGLRAVEDWVIAGTFFYGFVVCLCVLRCKLKGKV